MTMPLPDPDNSWEDRYFPIAYLITFRTYGTWLHGDKRTSVRKKRRTPKESKIVSPNVPFEASMREKMDQESFLLDRTARNEVEIAMRELCKVRGYGLYAINVRGNHVHVVIGVASKPERVADALKAVATKRLRELGLISQDRKVWSRGRSRRYLWKDSHVDGAIDYVLYGQGDLPFEIEGGEVD